LGDLAYKKRHKAQGLCTQCSRPALKGLTECAEHLYTHHQSSLKYSLNHRKQNADRVKNWKKEKAEKGLCKKCGQPKDPDMDGDNIICSLCIARVIEGRRCR